MRYVPVLFLLFRCALAANPPVNFTFNAGVTCTGFCLSRGIQIQAVTIDRAGNMYFTGDVNLTTFPATSNAFQRTLTPSECTGPPLTEAAPPCNDSFVVKLDPGGNIVWATYLGGNGDDYGTATFLTPPLSALTPFGFTDQTPNSSEAAVLPSGYVAMQLTDRIWFGLSFNSPFGLSTNFENPGWAGAFYAQSSSLRTYNGTPTVAIKITDWLSVGGGVQIQYAEPHLLFATGATAPGTPTLGLLTGHGWTVGWTAGVTLTPTPWTQIGLGYRKLGRAPGHHIESDRAGHGRMDGVEAHRHVGGQLVERLAHAGAKRPAGRTSVPVQRRLVLLGWSRIRPLAELDFPRWRRLRKKPDHGSGPHSAAAG